MPVTGDFSGLSRFAAQLGAIATPAFRVDLSKILAEEALEQIALGFEKERDPYGAPWKQSIRARRENGQTLSHTARMRRAWNRQNLVARPDGFTLSNVVAYTPYHQHGATIQAHKRDLHFKIQSDGTVGTRFVRREHADFVQEAHVPEHKLPKRMMVPEGERGLGPIWTPALDAAAAAFVESRLGGPT